MASLNMAATQCDPTCLNVKKIRVSLEMQCSIAYQNVTLLHISLAIRHPRVNIRNADALADALGCGHRYHLPAQGFRYAYS